MDKQAFERDRLTLFRTAGFTGRSTWFDDAAIGTTYGIAGETTSRGCPTILVHGGIADASVWSTMAPHVAGPVIILDRPGHGLTSDVDYAGVDYQAHAAAWLANVVDKLGVEQVNLVGNSMGGYFSMAFALAHPHRVRRLVLAGAPAGLDRQLPLFLRAWSLPVIGALVTAMMKSTKTPAQMRARVMKDMVTHPERLSDAALQIGLTAATRPNWHATMRSMLRAVADAGGWRRHLLMREQMAALTVPTLFAWGDRDSFAPPSSGQELAARMPSAHVEVLADAGHLPQCDSPVELSGLVNRFIAEPAVAIARAS